MKSLLRQSVYKKLHHSTALAAKAAFCRIRSEHRPPERIERLLSRARFNCTPPEPNIKICALGNSICLSNQIKEASNISLLLPKATAQSVGDSRRQRERKLKIQYLILI